MSYPRLNVRAATGLGLTSVALGLTEILVPEKIEKTMGIRNSAQNTGILRILGIREVLHGVDLLTHKDPMPGIRARCAGDLLDNVLLGAAGTRSRNLGGFLGVFAAVLPVVAFDMIFAKKRGRR